MKVTPQARKALTGGRIRRVCAHPATPGSVDSQGRDWNSNTLALHMEDGAVVHIYAGCYHFTVEVRRSA